jgi:hypothetical protein
VSLVRFQFWPIFLPQKKWAEKTATICRFYGIELRAGSPPTEIAAPEASAEGAARGVPVLAIRFTFLLA